MKKLTFLFIFNAFLSSVFGQTKLIKGRWKIEKAQEWYAAHKWINGANFLPSTAINQLEMWQKETFDPVTIDKELGWAAAIGMNTMRVYLHSLAWKADAKGFKSRIDQYLQIADKHHIKTVFVIFDDCWNAASTIGTQPSPKPGVHNSGWVQDPGIQLTDAGQMDFLEDYVKDILRRFKKDERILLWDLYNEPGNSGKGDKSMELLVNVFKWARKVDPDQPLSAGLWANLKNLNAFQALNSDVITYHDYGNEASHRRAIEILNSHGRPMICTEYMARRNASLFSSIMPMLKKENIGAINWGLVAGKSNTIYAWDTPIADGSEPALWFHDIFRKDGTPYKQEEVDVIKKTNGL